MGDLGMGFQKRHPGPRTCLAINHKTVLLEASTSVQNIEEGPTWSFLKGLQVNGGVLFLLEVGTSPLFVPNKQSLFIIVPNSQHPVHSQQNSSVAGSQFHLLLASALCSAPLGNGLSRDRAREEV